LVDLGIAAVRFADTDGAVITFDFDNRAQRITRMQAIGAAQGRIGDSDRMDTKVGNAHNSSGDTGLGEINQFRHTFY
jgi:hypothetical protein